MSMIMYVARGQARELERLAENGDGGETIPPAFERDFSRLTPEQVAQLEAHIRSQPAMAALAPRLIERLRERVSRGLSSPSGSGASAAATATAPRPETVDLHKSWHVLHYLFSGGVDEGGAPPANLLLAGGREIGDDDGYGPARLLSVAETASFAGFTSQLTAPELVSRLDGPTMARLGIYCANDGGAATREMADDVNHYFPLLQSHLRQAAAARQQVLIWLT